MPIQTDEKRSRGGGGEIRHMCSTTPVPRPPPFVVQQLIWGRALARVFSVNFFFCHIDKTDDNNNDDGRSRLDFENRKELKSSYTNVYPNISAHS